MVSCSFLAFFKTMYLVHFCYGTCRLVFPATIVSVKKKMNFIGALWLQHSPKFESVVFHQLGLH